MAKQINEAKIANKFETVSVSYKSLRKTSGPYELICIPQLHDRAEKC